MTFRVAALVVTTCLCGAGAAAQNSVPNLTRAQHDLLQALVGAVDAASTQPASSDLNWQSHVMRASDGSHYFAFMLDSSAAAPLPRAPLMLYVRLATAPGQSVERGMERSAIREWLAGNRTDPRLLPRRNIAIGEMPNFGAGSIAVRGSTASTGSNDLKLMALERERARQEQADRDKQRRAELEGRQSTNRDLLPFEDFSLAATATLVDGAPVLSRALTAGPGEYELYLAWADTTARRPVDTIQVVKRLVRLPAAASSALGTSTIILASNVTTRPAPYPPAEQASHPYAIGPMEVTPVRTARFSRDGRLAAVFQIINAQPNDAGMPDVAVGFRIVAVSGDRENAVASLNAQYYNATTLPPDFNMRLGHPLFAAVAAPLSSLRRGDYRLKVLINDRVAGVSTTAEADFSVVATPSSLLAEAPALAPPFDRASTLDTHTIAALVDALTPKSPSAPLSKALAVARGGKLIDLLVEDAVPASEGPTRMVLTALALLAAGDASSAALFERALQLGAPAGPTHFLLGVSRAAQSRDVEAITAWQTALAGGGPPAVTTRLLADAWLRRGDPKRASALLMGTTALPDRAWTRTLAATHLANGRAIDAADHLQAWLLTDPADHDARWLLLHALYSRAVTAPLNGPERERFITEARIYIDARAPHASLASDWLRVITS